MAVKVMNQLMRNIDVAWTAKIPGLAQFAEVMERRMPLCAWQPSAEALMKVISLQGHVEPRYIWYP